MSVEMNMIPNGVISNGGYSKPASGVVQSTYLHQEFTAPSFVTQLEPTITVDEGEPIRMMTQVAPAGDNTLYIDWVKDGQPLITGSRFSTLWDRGYAVLDIMYSIEEDSGVYMCVASSNSGQAQSSPANVEVRPEARVDNNANFLAAQQSQSLDSEPASGSGVVSAQPPQITRDIAPGGSVTVNQGEPIHLELAAEPRNDVTLVMDWLRDGNPISFGSRTSAIFDRGYCALDIAYAYPEDNGNYVCLMRNATGQIQSSAVQITCNPDEKIVTKSHLTPASINQLQMFENGSAETESTEFRHSENVEMEMAPVIDKGLQDLVIDEGLPAKFIIKVNSHPRARLVWSIDNEEVVSDSVNKFYNDGTINYLELSHCTDVGEHQLRVVATNPLGQVSSDSKLTVNPVHNYAKDLKHIAPENPYKKIALLRKVECTPELTNALHKPKPSTDKIVKIERTSEVKSKSHKTTDVMEAEKLYDQMAANLKSRGQVTTGKKSVLNYSNKPAPPPKPQSQPQPELQSEPQPE